MNLQQVAVIALLGAPFLAIGIYVEVYPAALANSAWTGLWGGLYITGWMASLEVMRRLNLAGTDPFGKVILRIGLATLALANVSNVWQAVAPTHKPTLYWILDAGWPLSHLLMLAVGMAVLRAKRLSGWPRWAPLAAGFWFPLTMALSRTPIGLHVSNLYSAVVWTLLAVGMLTESTRQQRAQIISGIALRDDLPQTFRI